MTNTTKHTPGPWCIGSRQHEDADTPVCVERNGGEGISIADVRAPLVLPCKGEDALEAYDAEVAANARLIAAAPDLLAELIGYEDTVKALEMGIITEHQAAMQICNHYSKRAAIAKAIAA